MIKQNIYLLPTRCLKIEGVNNLVNSLPCSFEFHLPRIASSTINGIAQVYPRTSKYNMTNIFK